MARIQVLPLTLQTLGPASHTPFVIVIDRLLSDGSDDVWSNEEFAEADFLKETLGAQSVLVIDGELTVDNVDAALHEAAAAAVQRALMPEQSGDA